jgi:hypothetical protein
VVGPRDHPCFSAKTIIGRVTVENLTIGLLRHPTIGSQESHTGAEKRTPRRVYRNSLSFTFFLAREAYINFKIVKVTDKKLG